MLQGACFDIPTTLSLYQLYPVRQAAKKIVGLPDKSFIAHANTVTWKMIRKGWPLYPGVNISALMQIPDKLHPHIYHNHDIKTALLTAKPQEFAMLCNQHMHTRFTNVDYVVDCASAEQSINFECWDMQRYTKIADRYPSVSCRPDILWDEYYRWILFMMVWN